MNDTGEMFHDEQAARFAEVAREGIEGATAQRHRMAAELLLGDRQSLADWMNSGTFMVPPTSSAVLHLYIVDDGEEHVYCARDAVEALRAHWHAFGAMGPDDPGAGTVQVQVECLDDDREVVVFNESREGFRWDHGAANVDLEAMAVPAPQESMERGQVVQGWKVAQPAAEWCRLFKHLMEMGSSQDVVVQAFAVRLYTTAA